MTISLDALVELNRLNMSLIIEAAGGTFDPAFRRTRLVSEVEAGSEIITVCQKNRLAAYLEFHITGNNCNVQSLQIHPDYQGSTILARLLSKVCQRLRNAPTLIINSCAHEGNTKSLSLHQKLGFYEVKTEGNRVFFEISGQNLIARLNRFEQKSA
ncbi:GNAT family N-acetyltransferase [Nostoc sp. DedQUE09]|uniref:GNAT family N-acetyltransferase n=1 Tax=Nostoc sp. DedQUE09 TaxID=3075394 RepID=UPI002AD5478D|nr:GNAT family N-acetyltransferase [Nostoc sp. DedQUE09]MDZ7956102.1 GNAT family N-acetyltransferase [Nostoc sp. DedQUE09]